MSTIILGIESSCDETAAAVCKDGQIINNIIATQSIHESYGGVVPELASRAHQKNIIPVINEALEMADISMSQINAIAYTQGPGLLGALLVGSSFAKAAALALGVPLIPVNHMQAHVLAHFIEDPKPEFPFLCLTVSGGHTQIVKVSSYLDMEIIGQTKDDAVGEAFDKCAKLLGVGYPGGPKIDKLAQSGNPEKFIFPQSDIPDLDYSFSGIKTAFMYFLRDEQKKNENFIDENINDLAASLQFTLIDMLFKKLKKAAKREKIKNIAIAGGVSANSGLRNHLQSEAKKYGWNVFIPKFEYCTDNAAMIATTGYLQYLEGKEGSLRDSPLPRMSFSS
ncbi:MAG: tRNA (adenosine(37)-N6)-threonylcarbamoyltransferase complex transferase subunit TsaD [Flammeovirgaceae bacterium]|nr:tRNA (adenosine(37)-N6)-threonylcarbamoyltransferase complex transferase subunit TsaD [Flammeovirgaceae bacterium]HCX22495.1 tRNA (adenosine(37)-N6)-threonylcarbamoyltransferase complex transferase subunit TsaD [Cytophagales bacterium]|tara:strand:- start:118 stop:1128 length:1011 start_codon:yes stop_codon:yes gene_type:complete